MAKSLHGGLGKGLGALLKPVEESNYPVQEIAVTAIQANPFQPRHEFDEEALEELKNSIQQYGVLQPLLVRKAGNAYQLIAGERRLRAATLAGLAKVPVLLREYTDAEAGEIALIENLQREDLNAIEEALAYDRLLTEFQLTQDTIAQKVGRSRSHIANFLRLLRLSDRVKEYIVNGSLSMGQEKPLLGIDQEALQIETADYIIVEELSARAAEELVKKIQKNPEYFSEKEKAPVEIPQQLFVAEAEDRLKMLLGTKVKIRPGKAKSKIEIEFYAEEDLDRIVEALTKQLEQKPEKTTKDFVV